MLLGKTEVYSTKELAAQNATHFLRKFVIDNHWLWAPSDTTKPVHWNKGGITAEHRMNFEECFQREDYEGCVKVWNTYAEDKNYPRPDYIARIQEKTIDKLFT